MVVVLGGTNDLCYSKPPSELWADLQRLYGLGHDYGAQVVAVTIPQHSQELRASGALRIARHDVNQRIRTLCSSDPAASSKPVPVLCDLARRVRRFRISEQEQEALWDDGLHFRPEGYDRFGRSVFDVLAPLLPRLAEARGALSDRPAGYPPALDPLVTDVMSAGEGDPLDLL